MDLINYAGKTEDENRQVLIATGSVVMNRVKSKEWGGTTIKDVLYANAAAAIRCVKD